MNGDYYIDMSVDNSYNMLKKDNSMNIGTKKTIYPLNEYNNDNKLIEGMGQFGRVNLQKCCPVNYMWSDKLKKCIKICDSCGVSAYGKINYEFLHNHGDEFFTYTTCEGDASGSYDYDKINKRYDKSELLNQYDMNIYGGGQGVDSEVQAAEENPWEEFSSYLDPDKGTSSGRGASEIEAEHKRRKEASERGEFTQRLEILDKNMYYIRSEITELGEGLEWPENNPWPTGGPFAGSWKMKNFSEWFSSGGKVSPIMHSLGTEFIPDKIIDPMNPSQLRPENEEYIQKLINEIDEGSDNSDEYGPVYYYYKNYLNKYKGNDTHAAELEKIKGKRNIICDAISVISGGWKEEDQVNNPYPPFYDKYCGVDQLGEWDEICATNYNNPNDDSITPLQEKSLLCDTLRNPAINVTLDDLCEGVEDTKLCVQ